MLLPGPMLLPLSILPYPVVPWLFPFFRRRMFFLSRRGGDACIALAGQAFSHRGRCKHPLPTSAPPPPLRDQGCSQKGSSKYLPLQGGLPEVSLTIPLEGFELDTLP